ncbi:hypothetical protein GCM10027187_40970 [Streptosporangium sandarakinum]|uniref:Lipoprotein n=1 Tax=Streptosporangium sandarakinum TaxID=1260955 RepID=A0A852VDW8_9ACTN|nr:hypothetical protein [Streptosporangium sandarakinum]NYF44571.1 hypothetical protein [Streptosporangium sandarakinum]
MPTPLSLRLRTALTAGALVAAITSCGGASTDLDAAGVIKALTDKGLPVSLTVTYTANDDPNKLLGRPNGYTSKASFTDQRVDASKLVGVDKGDVQLGGSVEVFDDADQAEQRADYIQQIGKKMPALGEYDYVAGPVLVRVSKELPPDQAKAFDTALGEIVE